MKKGAGREVRESPASLTTLPWDPVHSKPTNTDVFPDIASLRPTTGNSQCLLVRSLMVTKATIIRGGIGDLRFCGFGYFLDRFFGFGRHRGLRIFRFLASGSRFS